MLCLKCGTEMEYLKLTKPEFYVCGLEKAGYWECGNCCFTRAHYQRVPIVIGDDLIRSLKCFCCNDHGFIPDHLVRKYLMPEYDLCDPAIACLRCVSRKDLNLMWQIATPEDCELIDRAERAAFFQNLPEPKKVKQVVQEYITGMCIPESDDPEDSYDQEEHYVI